MRFLLALVAAGAAYYVYRNRPPRATGSTTNASDAMDDIHVRPGASSDEHLDAALAFVQPDRGPHHTGQRHQGIAVRGENFVDAPDSHRCTAPLSLDARALGAGTGRQRGGHQHRCDRAGTHCPRRRIIEKPLLLPSGS